jgi:YesN/AraC family two-component response regulator
LGLKVIEKAKNGEEAVSKFQKLITKPDLIVMDYHMPGKNGLEATQAILEIDKTAKIVIVSGDLTMKQKALASGAICFKVKSFNLNHLQQQIDFFKNQKIKRVKC